MQRSCAWVVAAGILLSVSPARAQRYALGDYCTSCSSASAANQFYDDGLHDDGAAGDGVLGAIVTVDKPAGGYQWWVNSAAPPPFGLIYPSCGCSMGAPARLYTAGPGDVIHFRLNGHSPGTGWGGQAFACDHGLPSGAHLEASYFIIENYPPTPWFAATHVGSIWRTTVTVPTAGTSSIAFRAQEDHGAYFSQTYNAWCGCQPNEQPYVRFTTTEPNSDVVLEFDEATGLQRATVLGPTPTHRSTWGAIKTIYR